jgi:ATP-dependent RNA helicase RhlE
MTGSGKTAAFGLPILEHLLRKPGKGTRALILTPTRELAAQVHEHLNALSQFTHLRSAPVFGGVSAAPQERALRGGTAIIVATPGRLLDHMQHPWCRFDALELLVLDEADRMLDMGFLPDVKRILSRLPKARQTMLFSATMPAPIVGLAQEMLVNPLQLGVARTSSPAVGISHSVYPVTEALKPHLLLGLLEEREGDAALVFTRTKHRANRLADFLESRGVEAARIHGNRSQAQREQALSDFKAGEVRVLVATDIAARGIDIEALPLVINFDVPALAEDYVHRSGRTARAGEIGDSIIFATPADARDLAVIERFVGKAIPRRKLSGFDYNARPDTKLEIPIAERIKEIRARKAADRARAAEKAERKAQAKAEAERAQLAKAAKSAVRGSGRRDGRSFDPAPGTLQPSPAARNASGGAPHNPERTNEAMRNQRSEPRPQRASQDAPRNNAPSTAAPRRPRGRGGRADVHAR